MSPPMQIASIDGRDVRYRIAGDPATSRTLVLVHAFPVGAGLFTPQEQAFPGWRIVIPALPGFDGSAAASSNSIDAYAGGVLRLLDRLQIERAVFGGVSLGGYVLFGILRQQPQRVSGLLLADTRATADAPEARTGREKMRALALTDGPSAVATEMLSKLLGETTHRERPNVVTAVRQMVERQTADGIAAAVDVLMTRPDSTPILETIDVPTLAIVGSEDVLTPPAEVEKMSRQIKGAKLVRLEGAGHLANFEVPEAFNQLVAGWLATEGVARFDPS